MTVLMKDNKYRNAKMKKMKIYSEKEVYNATSEMEKTRRNFWNEKAEQLCTQTKTAGQNKQTLMGIIDVSWTLRKTALIEEARKTTDEEVVISRHEATKPRIQKKKLFRTTWKECLLPMQLLLIWIKNWKNTVKI